MDLEDFITQGSLGRSGEDQISIPIKIVDPPEFKYDRRDMGGVGQGDADEGDRVEHPQDGDGDASDGDESGEPGEEGADHEYYEMDPEEFADALDEKLGLDLEPKGKEVIEEKEGEFTDIALSGPRSRLDVMHFFREGLKRKLAVEFDEEYVREALRVEGWDDEDVFEWARNRGIPVSRGWIDRQSVDDPDRWSSIEEMEANVERLPVGQRIREEGLDRLPYRREDERFRHPEIIEERERNAVVLNIRDASGSMREQKRELVERTFSPLDWYLQGKYDNAEFVYVVHDAEAWEVEREKFFGIQSGGGTRISSAYRLGQEILEDKYPWSNWNRFVFAAGDSENRSDDTQNRVIPLMEEIRANTHAYVETQPDGGGPHATHANELEEYFSESEDVVVARVNEPNDVMSAIETILTTESAEES